jgi:hypothetical protein
MRSVSILVLLALQAMSLADDNIVFLLDTSGSMGDHMRAVKQTRIQTAQDAMIKVMAQIPDNTNVGVLTFEGWIYDLQPINREKLTAAIRKTRPGGGTPLYQFMSQGATRLLEERQKQNNVGFYKLVVVTDGAATDPDLNRNGTFRDGSLRPGVLSDILMRGVIVDAIGLDLGQDHDLATKINGKYMRGDNPTGLEQALKKAVAEVGFGTSKDASAEAFEEVAALPPEFVNAAISGLTTFPNYPIGTQPPKKDQPTGLKQKVGATTTAQPTVGMSNAAKCGWVIGGVAVAILLVIGIAIGCQGD